MILKNFLRPALALVGLGTLILATAPGCSRSESQPKATPPAVTVAPVEKKEVVEWDEFTGRTEAVEAVEVRPRVSGYIQQVKFQSGQMVKKGDVLFVIDPRWHQADFDHRKAELDQAKVRVENSQREANRTPGLLANKAISTEEGDARQTRFEEARAGL